MSGKLDETFTTFGKSYNKAVCWLEFELLYKDEKNARALRNMNKICKKENKSFYATLK